MVTDFMHSFLAVSPFVTANCHTLVDWIWHVTRLFLLSIPCLKKKVKFIIV